MNEPEVVDSEGEFEPLVILDEQGQSDLHALYKFARAVGAYWRKPVKIDLFFALKEGPDPRPLANADLVRVAHCIRTGGTVAILANDRAAIDIAVSVIEAEGVAGHA